MVCVEGARQSEEMSNREGVLKLMCHVWNETHRRHDNEFLAHIDEEEDLTESISWDEMKKRLEEENKSLQERGRSFVSSAGTSAYGSVHSMILHVVCTDALSEEEASDVRKQDKSEKSELTEQDKVTEETHFKIPLKLVEKLRSKLKMVQYPSGYDKATRALILESTTVFNLNDIHPAFYKLGHRLADISEEQELRSFLHRVRQERFENLIQPIANGEDIADTGFSPETAESFLSEEEKEVLREWKADIASIHNIESAFASVEEEFMASYGIMEA